MDKSEEQFRRGFLQGFGVGSQAEEFAYSRLPTWQEVYKWSHDFEDTECTPPPGTLFEKKK